MSSQALIHLILTYRYWILIPLCFLEGPIVAFVAGTLASLGYFNIFLLALIFFVRDVTADGFMYCIGRFGRRTRAAKWFFKKIGVTDEQFANVHRLWENYTGRTMFFSKLSYGLSATFLVVAGIVELSAQKFFMYAAMVTVAQYGVLLILGYYFGGTFAATSSILNDIAYIIGIVTLFITCYYIAAHFMRQRLIAQEKKESTNTAI